MATSDKNPITARFDGTDAIALEEYQSGDTINPSYVEYDSSGNTQIVGTQLSDNLIEIEDKLDFFDNFIVEAKPYFSVYQTVSTLLVEGKTQVKFDTVAEDTETKFNTTLSLYVIPVAGIWRFSSTMRRPVPNTTETFSYSLSLYVNGVQKRLICTGEIFEVYNQPKGDMYSSGSCTISLNANDLISVWHNRTDAGATRDVSTITGAYNTKFSGNLHIKTL